MLLGALFLISPKLLKVMQLSKDAKALAAGSTVSTFKDSKTTIILDTYGEQLCTMKNEKDLYYVSFEQIPKTLQNAFIVMEDQSFYSHSGIDYKAIVRAVIANQKSNSIEQGASTITQQLARNIFLTQDVTWERKIEEIFLARELEKMYSKEQILEFYLNNIYFGNGYYGVEAAAKGYFNKSVADLTLSQQAYIAAIPNNPSRNDPFTKPDNVIARRNLILGEMYENDYINSMNYYSAMDEKIVLEQPVVTKNNSVETYARHCATEAMMHEYGFVFRNNFESDSEYEVYVNSYEVHYTYCQNKLLSGGYTIYTSIDMGIQEKLQKAVDDNMAGQQEMSSEGVYEFQSAATCIDNSSGNVVAIVGSRSQDLTGYTLNRAYQSYRQPGSSIKPLIVFTPYLQKGSNPDSIVMDMPIENGPGNADGTYSGAMTLRDAVKWSRNTVAWNIYQEITPKVGIGFMLNMGFHKVWMDKEYNAVALGGFTYGVSTEEMAGGYAALVNDGVYRQPTCIVKILNSSGRTIVDESIRGTVKIYDTNSSRMMTDMMKTVIDSGTGTNAQVQNAVVAGKTGTTNDDKDAWFCGYSRYYTTTVWVGYDMPRTIAGGGTYPTSIWRDFMTAVHEGLPKLDFEIYKEDNDTSATQETTTQEETAQQETVTETTTSETVVPTDSGQPTTKADENATAAKPTYPQTDWDAEQKDDEDATSLPDNG